MNSILTFNDYIANSSFAYIVHNMIHYTIEGIHIRNRFLEPCIIHCFYMDYLNKDHIEHLKSMRHQHTVFRHLLFLLINRQLQY